jgi:hypothetical protein
MKEMIQTTSYITWYVIPSSSKSELAVGMTWRMFLFDIYLEMKDLYLKYLMFLHLIQIFNNQLKLTMLTQT